MQTLFDKATYEGIVSRIDRLTPQTQRQWGSMDVAQMLAHCNEAIEMAVEHKKYPRPFIALLFGGMIKKKVISPKAYTQGLPTGKNLVITGPREFEKEKQRLLGYVKRFHEGGEKGLNPHPHPLFGKMTPGEWSWSQYKHLDHHMKQFGV